MHSKTSHSGHCLDNWRKMIWLGGQQFTAADFINIDSFIPVFNKWDANEHLRKLVEVDGEEKSGGEHVHFVYKIEIEEKVSYFCVDSTTSAIYSDLPSQIAINWHLSRFESDKRQFYQRLM